ncbi:MAG: cytochrome c biogenesis protein CcdA [Elusimicrobia bacterium]|nr:cytochrome c biogenesis protein CcdA [Candidatus Liberimonas magnetica]
MDNLNNFPVIASFLAGVASFVSPCILPMIPAYITFITGASLDELKSGNVSLRNTFLNALFFVLGFSFIFILLGASATYLGNLIGTNKKIIQWAGGIIIIIFGFHIMGILKLNMLYYEKRMEMKRFSLGYLGAFFIGIAFAIGWTPCIGPILSSILILASTQNTLNQGMMLLTIYSIGLGIPFLITAVFINKTLQFFTAIKRYFRIIEVISGLILIAIGFLILTNNFKFFTVLIQKFFS